MLQIIMMVFEAKTLKTVKSSSGLRLPALLLCSTPLCCGTPLTSDTVCCCQQSLKAQQSLRV